MEADVDVSDIENEDGKITVFTVNTDYFKAKQALLDSFGEIDFDVDEIQFIPQNYTTIGSEDMELFEKFVAMLDDLDDVQQVYHNVEMP